MQQIYFRRVTIPIKYYLSIGISFSSFYKVFPSVTTITILVQNNFEQRYILWRDKVRITTISYPNSTSTRAVTIILVSLEVIFKSTLACVMIYSFYQFFKLLKNDFARGTIIASTTVARLVVANSGVSQNASGVIESYT